VAIDYSEMTRSPFVGWLRVVQQLDKVKRRHPQTLDAMNNLVHAQRIENANNNVLGTFKGELPVKRVAACNSQEALVYMRKWHADLVRRSRFCGKRR